MAETEEKRGDENSPSALLGDRLRRTILPSYNLLFPRNRTNPMTYLGLLSFACFIVLAVSGVALMFYYSPDFTDSYDSVSQITAQVPFGFELRNIHYYAADFMVVLALAHFFYLYFAGRYRFHNEVLWMTGLAFGVLTVLDAYSGYVLIMNERAVFAANIGLGLLNSVSPNLQILLAGNSYANLVLRVYALHVIAIPFIMVLLAIVHLPRTLTVDLPVVFWITGAIVILGGLLPVPLGSKFVPTAAAPVTVPEWYLSAIYAFLRTGLPVFVAGVFLPFLLIFLFALVPFYDTARMKRSPLRKLIVAFGVAVAVQTILVTVWGVSSANMRSPLVSETQVAIDPTIFWSSFLLTGAASMVAAWLLYPHRIIAAWRTRIGTGGPYSLSRSVVALVGLVVVQVVLLILAVLGRSADPAVAMTEIGAVMILFGVAMRIYLDATNGLNRKQNAARPL